MFSFYSCIIRTTGGQNQSAVFEYKNPDITDAVIAGLNYIDIAGNRLTVQRIPESSASVLLKPTFGSPDLSKNIEQLSSKYMENGNMFDDFDVVEVSVSFHRNQTSVFCQVLTAVQKLSILPNVLANARMHLPISAPGTVDKKAGGSAASLRYHFTSSFTTPHTSRLYCAFACSLFAANW